MNYTLIASDKISGMFFSGLNASVANANHKSMSEAI